MAEKSANTGAYKNMNTAKKDMSPDFLKATEKDKQKTAAKNELSANEKTVAGSNIGQVSEGVDEVADNEKSVSSFTNNVTGRGEEQKGKGKGKGKGIFSKKGPITLILILTLTMGGLTLGGQAMQPFALVSNIIQNFDSASYSTTARLRTTLSAGLKGGSKVKLSNELEASLKLSGIDAEADGDGNLKSLSYKSKNGNDIVIDGDNVDNMLKDAEFSGKIAKTGEMVENGSFYNSKAKTYAADRIGWVKSRWDDYDTNGKTKAEAEAEFKRQAADPNAVKVDEVETYKYETEDDEGNRVLLMETDEVDGNGNRIYADGSGNRYSAGDVNVNKLDPGDYVVNTKTSNSSISIDDIENHGKSIVDTDGGEVKVSSDLNEISETVNKAGSMVSSAGCAYTTIASSVAAVTIALQIRDMINLASGFFEAVQGVQSGSSNKGVMDAFHMYNNQTNQASENGKGFWNAIGIISVFGGKTSGQSAGISNVENILVSGQMGVLNAGYDIDGWRTCTYSKLASNGIDFITDIASVFSFGLAKLFVGIGKKVLVSGAVAIVASIAIKGLIEIAKDIIKTEVVENMGSIAGGDYTVGGGNFILKQMGRATGLSAGSPEATANFAKYSESVIADRANYDRDNLSPFDITNKNTFLGSIVYSFTQFAVLNSGNPMNSTLLAIGTVLSNATSSFMPMTSATVYSNIASQDGGEDLCPLAASVGATASANHCIDYAISDTSSFGITYESAKNYLCQNHDGGFIREQLEKCGDGETPEVKNDSELEKYITLWTQRDTHLGLPDAAATSHKGETGSSLIDGMIGAVPFVGSAIDIVNAGTDAHNEGYILGSAYVIGGDDWEEDEHGRLMKNIQAFLELDTVYEELALTDTPVLATYLDSYYEQNPLDTSDEAILARISGLTKEEVVSTLAYIDYLDYVANYNPSNRYSFVKEFQTKFIKNIRKVKSDTTISLRNFVYSDVRNRNYAA